MFFLFLYTVCLFVTSFEEFIYVFLEYAVIQERFPVYITYVNNHVHCIMYIPA
jgi:hypothetical protein